MSTVTLDRMTRSQVARALGKSIATVRRTEGVHLHPRKGADGVNRFDAEEVQQLQTDLARRSVRLTPHGFPHQPEHGQGSDELARENRILRDLLEAVVDMVRSRRAYRSQDAATEEFLDAVEEFMEA